MGDLLVLDFLCCIGLPDAYGWLIKDDRSCTRSVPVILDAWKSSGLGVISVGSIVIQQRFKNKQSFRGGAFTVRDWSVVLKGFGVNAGGWFLVGLGGKVSYGGVEVSFSLFHQLCVLGVLGLSDVYVQGSISLVCSFVKTVTVNKDLRVPDMRSWYCYNYSIFTGDGDFIIQGEDERVLHYGDYWVSERAFARLILNSSVARSFCSFLFV